MIQQGSSMIVMRLRVGMKGGEGCWVGMWGW